MPKLHAGTSREIWTSRKPPHIGKYTKLGANLALGTAFHNKQRSGTVYEGGSSGNIRPFEDGSSSLAPPTIAHSHAHSIATPRPRPRVYLLLLPHRHLSAHECQNMLDVAASMALDGQLAFAALSRSEDELTRLVEEERADLTTKRRRYEYMGSMYARGSEKISQTVVKATAVKTSADENHGQGPPQATRVRARNNPKAPPDGERRTAGWEHQPDVSCLLTHLVLATVPLRPDLDPRVRGHNLGHSAWTNWTCHISKSVIEKPTKPV